MTLTDPDDEQTPLLGKISGPEPDTEPSHRDTPIPPLGGKIDGDEPITKTPLPWAQLSMVLLLQLAEPLTAQVIFPFTPELIRSLNVAKNEAEVGYYVGIMQSLFFATQACTILHWSRLSDHIGRKPVILTGLFGLSLSMYCFGLSKTFWGLVLSRALSGALNGNSGVLKSVLIELTDQTNIASAFSWQPLAWSTGSTLGPMIGGALSHPVERFPDLFGNNKFFKQYPYFLPCAIPASFTLVSWFVAFFFLKETHPSPKPIRVFLCGTKNRVASEEDPLLLESRPQDQMEKPTSLRGLLTRDVIITCVNYSFLALVDISFRTLQPVFFSTPLELGGLGIDPPMIGTIMSSFGILNGVFTVFFFSRLLDYLGLKRFYLIGITAAVPSFLLFPVINYLARNSIERSGRLGTEVWLAVGLQVALSVLFFLCYGAVFIFIAAAAPNKASLGATNGLAQLSASVVRAVGPALASSLYSLSIDKEHHYMNGQLVYYVTVTFSLSAILVGSLFPSRPFRDTGK